MMGDTPRADSGSIAAKMVWQASSRSGRAVTVAEKVVKAILDGLDRNTFVPRDFAMLMSLSPAPVQRIFLTSLVIYFRALSEMAAGRLHMTEDERMIHLDGALIYEAIKILDTQ